MKKLYNQPSICVTNVQLNAMICGSNPDLQLGGQQNLEIN